MRMCARLCVCVCVRSPPVDEMDNVLKAEVKLDAQMWNWKRGGMTQKQSEIVAETNHGVYFKNSNNANVLWFTSTACLCRTQP